MALHFALRGFSSRNRQMAMKLAAVIAIYTSLMGIIPARAAPDEATPHDLALLPLERLMAMEVVSASKFPQRLTEAPASVTVTSWLTFSALTSTVVSDLTWALPRMVAVAFSVMSMMFPEPPMAAFPPLVPRNFRDSRPTALTVLMSFLACTVTAWLGRAWGMWRGRRRAWG